MVIEARQRSLLGVPYRSPLGAFGPGPAVAGNVHEYDLIDRLTNQQYFQCPGSFTDPDYTLLRAPSSNIFKSQMTPPIPLDPVPFPQKITQVVQVETPTGLIFDASSYPIWDSLPPCYDPNFGNGVIQIRDLGIGGGDQDIWDWTMYIFQDGSEADWPVGTYKFTLLYEPY